MRKLAILSLAVLGGPALAQDGGAVLSFQLPAVVNYPTGVAFDGQELFVANLREATVSTSQDAIYALDPCTGAYRRTFASGRVLQQLAFDGTQLWAIKMYTKVEKLGPAGNAVSTFNISSSVGLAWDSAQGGLWALEDGSTAISLYAPNGVLQRTINTAASHASWGGLAHDGCSLWSYDRGTQELVRIDPGNGAELERITFISPAVEGLGFDGRHLIVSDNNRDQVTFLSVAPATIDGGSCTPGFGAGISACFLADAGVSDGGPPDAGAVDAGAEDAGAGGPDAGPADSGLPDAGPPAGQDAGPTPDAGPPGSSQADGGTARQDGGQGCGCGLAGAPAAWLLFGLAAPAARLARRRNQTTS
ncbi:MAG: hypothetical protein HYZ28_16140 [Myxococcales bacterium]|nr:hypothetical protein [Myxococcales bacterium]